MLHDPISIQIERLHTGTSATQPEMFPQLLEHFTLGDSDSGSDSTWTNTGDRKAMTLAIPQT